MSIASSLAALQEAKADIVAAIRAKGGTVAAGDGMGDFAARILSLPERVSYDKNKNAAGYIDSSGAVINTTAFYVTEYLPVFGYASLHYSGITTPGVAPMSAFYSMSGGFISSFKQAAGANTIAIPANAYYVRFSLYFERDIDTFSLRVS